MPSRLLVTTSLVFAVIAQGCSELMPRESHEKIVRSMREEIAQLQIRAAEAEDLRKEKIRLEAENQMLRAHNSAYAELSAELRTALDNLGKDGIQRLPNGGWSIETHILFRPGSAKISTSGRDILKRFLDVWKGKAVKFRIVGHTDSDPIVRSADKYKTRTNLELGMHRALSVMEVLLQEGVSETDMIVESRGNAEPLVPEDGSAENKKRNRRVEIYVLKK